MGYPQQITKTIKEFKYFSPKTVDEAVSILKELEGKAKVLAGGTDLLPMIKLRTTTPECIVNIKNIAGLDYIREEGAELKIGALTRISTIRESDLIKQKCLSVYEATRTFGTPQVRNIATVGGNICRSSPSADMAPPLVSFDAEGRLVGPKGARKVLLENFFTGAGENVLDREILTEIVIPLAKWQYGTAFEKVTRSSADLAKVNCAVKITVRDGRCDDIRIILGAVANMPVRARKAEQVIKGKEINDEVIQRTVQEVIEDITPITDVRSTADYRSQVSKILVRRLIKQAIERVEVKE